MKKTSITRDVLHFSYQVIVTTSKGKECSYYGTLKYARSFYKFLKHWYKIHPDNAPISIEFYYICMRFDNCGRVKVGCGKTKKECVNSSIIDYSKEFNFLKNE